MKVIIILYLLLLIIEQIGWGLIFKKMGFHFYEGIIPFYNKIKLMNYYKIPEYNIVLVFIPIVDIIIKYLIYKNICKQYHKEKLYVIELTFFPFIYNFFLAFEIKSDKTDNYFEDQKNIYEMKEKNEIQKDEYVWHPKKENVYNGIYKATRNNINTKITLEKNNDIIDKKIIKEKKNTKVCPNCGAKIGIKEEVCYICGTKI